MEKSELYKMAGMLSKIAYKMSDEESLSEELKELFLDFWREFNIHEE